MNYVRNFLPSFDAQNNFISPPPLDRLGAHTSQGFSSPKCFIVLVLHSFGTKMAVLSLLEVWEQYQRHQGKWCVLTCILRASYKNRRKNTHRNLWRLHFLCRSALYLTGSTCGDSFSTQAGVALMKPSLLFIGKYKKKHCLGHSSRLL